MRYIKVFLLVLLFFVIMMLFVQNQASFSDPVTLKFDPMFAPVMESMPLPRYALLLMSFALGAVVVLAMLFGTASPCPAVSALPAAAATPCRSSSTRLTPRSRS